MTSTNSRLATSQVASIAAVAGTGARRRQASIE